jgi:hypothetical protein
MRVRKGERRRETGNGKKKKVKSKAQEGAIR